MSRVYQCDKCKRIFEPRMLKGGEPYIARKGRTDLDLCPKCYELLMDFSQGKPYEERPTGEWIDTGSKEEYWDEEYQCSICGEKDHWHNFCPNCGADMRKEAEND